MAGLLCCTTEQQQLLLSQQREESTAAGVEHSVCTRMGNLALYSRDKGCSAGIQITHDEHWLPLGVKQVQYSYQLHERCCLGGYQASLNNAGPVWGGQRRHVD